MARDSVIHLQPAEKTFGHGRGQKNAKQNWHKHARGLPAAPFWFSTAANRRRSSKTHFTAALTLTCGGAVSFSSHEKHHKPTSLNEKSENEIEPKRPQRNTCLRERFPGIDERARSEHRLHFPTQIDATGRRQGLIHNHCNALFPQAAVAYTGDTSCFSRSSFPLQL